MNLMSRGFRGISPHSVPRYSTVLLTTVPLHSGCGGFLQIQDGLLAQKDQKLPFARHVISALQHVHLVKHMVVVVLVGTQKVVVSNPQGKVIARTVDVIKAVGFPVGGFVGAVKPFDHLLERAEFFGDSIVVGKPDYLGNAELKGITEPVEELLGSKGVGAVTIGDKAEVFREFLQVPESHAHRHDAGTDATVIRNPVADNGAFGSIHNEPDIGFDAPDFDICFIGGKGTAWAVIVVVYERLNADRCGLAVVGGLLMGDMDVIQLSQGLGCFPEGKAKVYMESQGHDMGIKLAEFEGRSILREGI